jgi:hypothetical protein
MALLMLAAHLSSPRDWPMFTGMTPTQPKTDWFCILAFIFGILSLASPSFIVGGIISGHYGLYCVNHNVFKKGRGWAIAGLGLSYFVLLLFLISIFRAA